MLDVLRKRKRSWIILFLLGLIIIVFIAFYGGNQLGDSPSQDIAEVNGEIITQREFAVHYQRALERYRELLKGSLTPELEKTLNLRGSLLEELIQKRLLLQEARKLGLSASDEDLMTAIAQVPDFQVNGRFNKERYLQLLRANGLNPGQFEEEQREQLTIQRLYGILLDAVHVTEAEVRDRYRFDQDRRRCEIAALACKSQRFSTAAAETSELTGRAPPGVRSLRKLTVPSMCDDRPFRKRSLLFRYTVTSMAAPPDRQGRLRSAAGTSPYDVSQAVALLSPRVGDRVSAPD
jgi:hypothetical protein